VCDHRDVTILPSRESDLRRQLTGVRGLLLDMDGVLVMRSALIAGAVESLAALDAAALPYLLATNTSIVGRGTLSLELGRAGLSIPADRIVSAASAAAAYARRRFAGRPIYVLVAPDARTEFEGQLLLSHDEAARPGARAAAVVVGDAGEEFTPRNIQTAFTLLRGGARFVAMHKNRWWLTPAGAMLDSGAYVAALEFGAQKRALVTGKPSRAFFGEGLRLLGDMLGAGSRARLTPWEAAMVGDDLWNDIRGAQKAGMRGVFVRSGKHGDAELARVSAERGGRVPDAVAPSIVEVVAALIR
jgi:HAD superfamily hydrolase (TIGR01458 family)